MAADVLDFVGDRAAVGRAQRGKCLGERLSRDIDAEDFRRDARHDFRRESQTADVERRIARRLAAERIEMCGEVAEVSMRSNECVGSRDVAEIVDGRSRELGVRSWGWVARGWNSGP